MLIATTARGTVASRKAAASAASASRVTRWALVASPTWKVRPSNPSIAPLASGAAPARSSTVGVTSASWT